MWREQAQTQDLVPSHSRHARGLTLGRPQPRRGGPTGVGGVTRELPAGPPGARRRAGLTCDVLAPGVVQVRGQHVPHGEEEPRPDPPVAARAAQADAAGAMEPGAYRSRRPWLRPPLCPRSSPDRVRPAGRLRPAPQPAAQQPLGAAPRPARPRPRSRAPPPPWPPAGGRGGRGRRGDLGRHRDKD